MADPPLPPPSGPEPVAREQVPLFPLNLVAFPGMTLPLHIFEDRYLSMVRRLLSAEDPAQRLFGVVAIREGYEVGTHEARSMYRTGCLMQLTDVEELDDGRFNVVAVGRGRMRVMETDAAGELLMARVEELPSGSEPLPETLEAAARALAVFDDYRRVISGLRGDDVMTGTLPRDPELLSFVLAATCSLTLPERQQLLESPTALERLGLIRRMLRAEVRTMRAIPSLPATEVARTGWNPN